jgi:hypothetical protein
MRAWVVVPAVMWLAACVSAQELRPDRTTAPAQRTAAECGLTSAEAFMSMDYDAFDQQPTGWRSIRLGDGVREGCERARGDLIEQYVARNYPGPQADGRREAERQGMLWHLAQSRAMTGDVDRALELLRANVRYEEANGGATDGDLAYARGTVAYMEGDLARLRQMRDELAATPKPEGWEEGLARLRARRPDVELPPWPPNVPVLDKLIRCFDRPYREAYACPPPGDAAAR